MEHQLKWQSSLASQKRSWKGFILLFIACALLGYWKYNQFLLSLTVLFRELQFWTFLIVGNNMDLHLLKKYLDLSMKILNCKDAFTMKSPTLQITSGVPYVHFTSIVLSRLDHYDLVELLILHFMSTFSAYASL